MIWLYLLVGVSILLIGYYLWLASLTQANTAIPYPENPFPVSLIVCAKNEAENLEKHIPLWLEQDHPDFELVLVNDRSVDDSGKIMESWAVRDSRIKIVDVQEIDAFWANKKYALTLGIKRASHQRLIFTDADCRPGSKSWLRKMSSLFDEQTQLVLGYGPYERHGGLLNALIRYETFVTATQYLNAAFKGNAYMGVGRNLGYTQYLFYDQSGFMNHMDVASGDDDLFVNHAANASNVALSMDPETFTYSIPKRSWADWLRQKRRHLTTARHYKGTHKFVLGLLYLLRWSFWVLLVIGLLIYPFWWALIPVLITIGVQYVVQGRLAERLSVKSLSPFFPLFDLLLLCTQLAIFSANLVAKPKRWK